METTIRFANCLVIFALLWAGNQAMSAPSSGGTEHLGIRLGWSGAPNGLTYRKVLGPRQAIEMVIGYNGKVGRTQNLPLFRRGNSFIGASYAPFFEMGDDRLGVLLNADVGARARYHHYRSWRADGQGGMVTPDLIAGGGFQVTFSGQVQLFADLHIVCFNRYDNVYVPGVESGLGLRVAI